MSDQSSGIGSAPDAHGGEVTAAGAGPSMAPGPGTTREPDIAALREGPGTRIGPYKLLQQLGEGGFGTVFLAEQEKPVRRNVALKIIKLGMDTRQVVARFEVERQALALMDHPNIARVLDAGATETGRPFFVMDLVKGEPIVTYCDKNQLSIAARLELFAQVCTAVQHAHTKGIIHRDLKPNNILVSTLDGRPFAKVIDFGIAKATASKLTEQTLVTDLHMPIGTIEFMSPEQAEGSMDIDTRTDIYSLGVVLYILLTGSAPFQGRKLRSEAFDEIQRIIREVDPPMPSTRLHQSAETLAAVAAKRKIEPHKLGSMLRGELDWIVMKALEKDRSRRYETANGLAQDIRRYLGGEAVLAAPPGKSYQFKKFVRRNRGPVLAGSAIALALLAGIIGFAWQARLARNRAAELEKVAKFQAEMLAQVDPTEAGKLLSENVRAKFEAALAKGGVPETERPGQIEAFAGQWKRVNATDAARELIDRTILKPAVEAIDKQFQDQPIVAATLRQALASRYQQLGLYAAALPLQERALATRREVLGENHPDTVRSIMNMGRLLQLQGKLEDAEPYFRDGLARSRETLGARNIETLSAVTDTGNLFVAMGKLSEAEPYVRESLAMSRSMNGPENFQTMVGMNSLGLLLMRQNRHAEAEPLLREVLATGRRVLGEDHPETITFIGNLGGCLKEQNRLPEAEPFFRETLEKRRRVQGEEHPLTVTATHNMGILLLAQGKPDEAEPFFLEALGKRRRLLGLEHQGTVAAIMNLASVRLAQGRTADAVDLLAPAESAARKVYLGENAAPLANLLRLLGKARVGLGQFEAAEANLLEVHTILSRIQTPIKKPTRDATQALADFYVNWNTADPGKGHDAQATEWKAKLEL